jgi:peptidoglycan/LPS O-acetylase OafA/YrhL
MGTIRALLAIMVVFAHSPFQNGAVGLGGQGAVEIFYMISGFLIHHVLVNQRSYSAISSFYKSRALRIAPLYFAVLLPSLLACFAANPSFKSFYASADVGWMILVGLSNLTIIGQDWIILAQHLILGNDGGVALYKGLAIPQAWTLSLELVFYLLAPFLLKETTCLLGVASFALLVKLYLVYLGLGSTDPWSYRFFPAELVFFLLGAISNRFLLPLVRSLPRQMYLVGQRFSFFLAIVLILFFNGEKYFGALEWGGVVLIFALVLPFCFDFQEKYKWDKYVGELSYPIYISHVLVVWSVAYFSRRVGYSDAAVVTCINIFLVVILSVSINKYFLVPIEVKRRMLKAAQSG